MKKKFPTDGEDDQKDKKKNRQVAHAASVDDIADDDRHDPDNELPNHQGLNEQPLLRRRATL